MDFVNLKLILIFCPLIISIIIYYLSKLFLKHSRRTFHFMISWTTIFYVVAVTLLLQDMFSINLIGTMPILLLIILSIILIIQWRTRTEVVLKNGLKLLWRFSFLIFTPVYIGLVVYQMIMHFMI